MKKTFCFLILAILMLTAFAGAESEYLHEPIVFTFNSAADMAQNLVRANALNHSFENGCTKLVNTTKGPYFWLPIDTLVLTHLFTNISKYVSNVSKGRAKA